MKKEEFKNRLKTIGSSQKKFALLTDYGYSTVKAWETIPHWANLVLMYMELTYKLHTLESTFIELEGIREKVSFSDLSKYLGKGMQ